MIRLQLRRSTYSSLRRFLHEHGQPTAQRHAPERFGLFAPIHAHESVKRLAELMIDVMQSARPRSASSRQR